jgi:hypothetical protein
VNLETRTKETEMRPSKQGNKNFEYKQPKLNAESQRKQSILGLICDPSMPHIIYKRLMGLLVTNELDVDAVSS